MSLIARISSTTLRAGLALNEGVSRIEPATGMSSGPRAVNGAAASGLPSAYIRPIAYYGYGEMGLNTLPCSVDVSIACWPWGAYLGDDDA